MPRYIRNTDAFGWQGADNPDGPWRSIAPPQRGTPWQQGNTPMDDLRQTSAEVSGVEVLSQPFSPAAQAVLDAYASKIADNPLNWLPRHAIAVALGALVDQLAYADSEGRQFLYAPEVRAIAAELEGHHA